MTPLIAGLRAALAGLRNSLGKAAKADIVGTVSQSAGEPTGAIIQYGTSPTGNYIKYADGTMICYETVELSYSSADNLRATWNYPVAFTGVPKVTHCPVVNSSTGYGTSVADRVNWGISGTANPGASSVILDQYRCAGAPSITSPATLDTHAVAIGRWF